MSVQKMKMRFTLSEDDGGETYEYDPAKLMLQEATFVERITGSTMQEWQNGIQNGSALAIGALIFMLKKRAGEKVGDFTKFDMNLVGITTEVVGEDGKVITQEELQAMNDELDSPKSGDDASS